MENFIKKHSEFDVSRSSFECFENFFDRNAQLRSIEINEK